MAVHRAWTVPLLFPNGARVVGTAGVGEHGAGRALRRIDNVSATKPEEAIRSAQMADALVYSILFANPFAYSSQRTNPRNRGVQVLRRLSGSYFEIGRTQRLDKVFAQIEQEVRSEYGLGYISDQVDAAPRDRKIRLSTRRDGLLVQARDGYFVFG
jgi:hypothetical protein